MNAPQSFALPLGCWPHAAPAPTLGASCWAVVLYALLGVAMLAPLASDIMPESPACDLGCHVSGIIEARNALREGQFPVRVSPVQHDKERYPFFQFYGQLPYTVGGAIYDWTGWSPYSVWKLTVILSLIVGGYFTYRCAFLLTGQTVPALIGGAVLVMAPYMQIDVQARFAYPETVAFCIAPAVLFFSLRTFAEPGLLSVLGGAVSWAGVALTHSVVLFYGALFFSLLFLSYPHLLMRSWRGTLRLGVAAGLGAALSAWHLVAQAAVHDQLAMFQNLNGSPIHWSSWLTPIGSLLAPTLAYPAPIPHAPLCGTRAGYQVGWPILAGVALALHRVVTRYRDSGSGAGVVVRLAALFGLAFLLTWSPIDVWRALPEVFSCALYSCRFLVFVVLWGSLLTAMGLALRFPGQLGFEHLLGSLLVLGVCVGPYLPQHASTTALTVEGEIAQPNLGRGGGLNVFQITPEALVRTGYEIPPGANIAGWDHGLIAPFHRLRHPGAATSGTGTGLVPAPRAGDTLFIDGIVPAPFKSGTTLTVALDDRAVLCRHLPPGPFQLAIPITDSYRGERVPLRLSTDRALDPAEQVEAPIAPNAAACYITRIVFQTGGAAPAARGFISAEALKPVTQYGRANTCNVTTAVPALVQVPVLYYPKLLRVRVDGNDVSYGNFGRFVAVELPPGDHHVRITFRGVPWANTVSLVTALVLASALAALLSRRSVGLLLRSVRKERNSDEPPVVPLGRAA